MFSIIYASTTFTKIKLLWDSLRFLSQSIKDPWLIAGDFNEILSQQDKRGSLPINISRNSEFWSCINHCNLLDLDFKGSRYT